MEFNSFEYSCEKAAKGTWLLRKILFVFLYGVYTASYFLLIYVTRIIPLGALIPVTLWILIYFTWRYTSPEYRYVIERDRFTLFVKYGTSKPRLLTEFNISQAISITPVSTKNGSKAVFSTTKVYNALPHKDVDNAYCMIFNSPAGKLCAVYFVAIPEALRLIRLYNKNAIS